MFVRVGNRAYPVRIVLDEESGYFSALATSIDVCSQGRTIDEALKNLCEAVELYLEDEDVKKKFNS